MKGGRTITLFLVDGSVTGVIKYTLSNWTGVVYKIPRTALKSCKDREDLQHSGVYFLFGKMEKNDKNIVYVGQAGTRKNGNSFLQRIREEHKEINDWTEAVAITTQLSADNNNSLGQTEICYLEHRFTKLAKNAKQYIVKNKKEPNPGNISEEKECELEEFIDNSKIVMEILGHKVFVPNKSPKDAPKKDIVYLKGRDADATGILTNEGIIVCKDSKIKASPTPSCPDWIKKLRIKNKEHIKDNVLSEDITFSSPSQAAGFCMYGSANGRVAWKNKSSGKTLKELDMEN